MIAKKKNNLKKALKEGRARETAKLERKLEEIRPCTILMKSLKKKMKMSMDRSQVSLIAILKILHLSQALKPRVLVLSKLRLKYL